MDDSSHRLTAPHINLEKLTSLNSSIIRNKNVAKYMYSETGPKSVIIATIVWSHYHQQFRVLHFIDTGSRFLPNKRIPLIQLTEQHRTAVLT